MQNPTGDVEVGLRSMFENKFSARKQVPSHSPVLLVDIEAGFLEREGCSSDHAGFITETGGKKAKILFEGRAELAA